MTLVASASFALEDIVLLYPHWGRKGSSSCQTYGLDESSQVNWKGLMAFSAGASSPKEVTL